MFPSSVTLLLTPLDALELFLIHGCIHHCRSISFGKRSSSVPSCDGREDGGRVVEGHLNSDVEFQRKKMRPTRHGGSRLRKKV